MTVRFVFLDGGLGLVRWDLREKSYGIQEVTSSTLVSFHIKTPSVTTDGFLLFWGSDRPWELMWNFSGALYTNYLIRPLPFAGLFGRFIVAVESACRSR